MDSLCYLVAIPYEINPMYIQEPIFFFCLKFFLWQKKKRFLFLMATVNKKVTINCVSLNQDQDVLAFGTNEGFMVYCADPFAKRFERKITGGVGIIELLFRSNILAFVGTGTNKEYSLQKVSFHSPFSFFHLIFFSFIFFPLTIINHVFQSSFIFVFSLMLLASYLG